MNLQIAAIAEDKAAAEVALAKLRSGLKIKGQGGE